MGRLHWDMESPDENRVRMKAQDARFQRAMRDAFLAERPASRQPPVQKTRDIIDLSPKPVKIGRRQTTNNDPRSSRIVIEVAIKHGFTGPEITSSRRFVPLVAARHEAMWRLSKETSMSLPAIGRKLGGKDHTTVLYGIRRHEERMRQQA